MICLICFRSKGPLGLKLAMNRLAGLEVRGGVQSDTQAKKQPSYMHTNGIRPVWQCVRREMGHFQRKSGKNAGFLGLFDLVLTLTGNMFPRP